MSRERSNHPCRTDAGADLLRSATWGQTLVDYVTVQEPARRVEGFGITAPREFAFAKGPARDFRAEDVELRLEEPRASINGRLEASSLRIRASAEGAVTWIYVPSRTERITINAAGRIAPGQAAFNLYVLHDPTWRPTYPKADLGPALSALTFQDRAVMDGAERGKFFLHAATDGALGARPAAGGDSVLDRERQLEQVN